MIPAAHDGRIDNRYDIAEQIGAGGMGVVFRAHDRLTGQDVALKRVHLRPDRPTGSVSAGSRFTLAREFQASAALHHPQIVRVLDYGFDDLRQPFLTMELLHQPKTILGAAYGLPPIDKLRLLVQALHALLYVHRRGFLHRDLKPANILVVNGTVKLVDFGLASAKSQDEEMAGTIGYMAPELLQSGTPSEASDLYALGVVAYEMLVGQHPFNVQDAHIFTMMQRILNESPDWAPLLALHEAGDFSTITTRASGSSSMTPDSARADDNATIVFPYTKADDSTRDLPTVAGAFLSDDAPTLLFDALRTMQFDALDLDATILFPPEAEHAPTPVKPSAAPMSPPHMSPEETSTVPGIIARMLARSPADRYDDAADVIRHLSGALKIPLPVETAITRESFLQAAQFIGRERELDKLNGALARAIDGNGALWFVAGESGVGKSRLLDEVRIQALTQGALVVRGQAADNGAAYTAWREPLKRLLLNVEVRDSEASVLLALVPDIADLIGRPVAPMPIVEPEEAINRLIVAVNGILRRQLRPVLILLEDVHWMTRESFALLEAVQLLADRLPLLVIASFRSDELTPDLEMLLDPARTLQLRRLTRDEIVQLSASMIGERGTQAAVIDLLERETEGNVFFIVEVVRALAEEAGQLEQIGSVTLPATLFVRGVQQVVERRLARLAPLHFPLLGLAAIMGRVIDRTALSQTVTPPKLDEWLFACERINILEAREDSWQFTHDKIREGVLSALEADGRTALHRRAALSIASAYPGMDAYAGALAYHWEGANDADREQSARVSAGRYAYQAGSFERALEHYERALTLLNIRIEREDTSTLHSTLGRLLNDVARVQWRSGDRAGADARLTQAASIAYRIGDSALRAHVIAHYGQIALAEGDITDASIRLSDSLALYETLDQPIEEAEVLTMLARSYTGSGRYADAEPLLERALVVYQRIDQPSGLAHAYYALAELQMGRGELDTAESNLQQALTLSQTINDRNYEAATLMQLGSIALYRGQLDEARANFTRSLERFESVEDQYGMAACLNNLGFVALYSDDLDNATVQFERSLELSDSFGDQWGTANTLANLGHVALRRAQPDDARGLYLRSLAQAAQIGAVPVVVEVLAALAPMLLANPRHAALALSILRAVVDHPAATPDIRDGATTLLAKHPDSTAPALAVDPDSVGSDAALIDLRTLVDQVVAAMAPQSALQNS
ncbi:MAG: tetratricopeptide repeat protein [Chloroflexota bacterium]|nr:tetratricopeptide repeat protein [Chloroflexota bacterium]